MMWQSKQYFYYFVTKKNLRENISLKVNLAKRILSLFYENDVDLFKTVSFSVILSNVFQQYEENAIGTCSFLHFNNLMLWRWDQYLNKNVLVIPTIIIKNIWVVLHISN